MVNRSFFQSPCWVAAVATSLGTGSLNIVKVNPTTIDRIAVFRAAWRELAPQEVFAGMTLTQFETATNPSVQFRDDILALERQLEGQRVARDTADLAANALLELVVNSVRGTPAFGSDSSLYRAMGYVRKSERRSGLTRKNGDKPAKANAA